MFPTAPGPTPKVAAILDDTIAFLQKKLGEAQKMADAVDEEVKIRKINEEIGGLFTCDCDGEGEKDGDKDDEGETDDGDGASSQSTTLT